MLQSLSPPVCLCLTFSQNFGEIIERKQQSCPRNRLLHPAQTGDLLTFRSEKLFWISMQKCLNFIWRKWAFKSYNPSLWNQLPTVSRKSYHLSIQGHARDFASLSISDLRFLYFTRLRSFIRGFSVWVPPGALRHDRRCVYLFLFGPSTKVQHFSPVS